MKRQLSLAMSGLLGVAMLTIASPAGASIIAPPSASAPAAFIKVQGERYERIDSSELAQRRLRWNKLDRAPATEWRPKEPRPEVVRPAPPRSETSRPTTSRPEQPRWRDRKPQWTGHSHRDRRWRRHHRDYYRPGYGSGIIFGWGSNSYDPYYDPYYQPYRPYRTYRTYRTPRTSYSVAHLRWCEARYRTYRASDNTFVARKGVRKQCISPYIRYR